MRARLAELADVPAQLELARAALLTAEQRNRILDGKVQEQKLQLADLRSEVRRVQHERYVTPAVRSLAGSVSPSLHLLSFSLVFSCA